MPLLLDASCFRRDIADQRSFEEYDRRITKGMSTDQKATLRKEARHHCRWIKLLRCAAYRLISHILSLHYYPTTTTSKQPCRALGSASQQPGICTNLRGGVFRVAYLAHTAKNVINVESNAKCRLICLSFAIYDYTFEIDLGFLAQSYEQDKEYVPVQYSHTLTAVNFVNHDDC